MASLDSNDDDEACTLAAHQLLVLKLRVEFVAVAMTLSMWQRGTLQVAGVVTAAAATACCNVTCVAERQKEENVQLMLLRHAIACQQCGSSTCPCPLNA